jgi:hypothetical protein
VTRSTPHSTWLEGAETDVMALIVRYRCEQTAAAQGERRCNVEVEDVEARDKFRFADIEEGIAHLRERFIAFACRAQGPAPSVQPE